MFKKSKFFLIVDSVESAIKFYAEKLLFTVTDIGVELGANSYINYAELRRGKCFLVVRAPALTELADFSMVRRLNNRAVGMHLELKEGLEDFFSNCKKKKINVTSDITRHSLGYVFFQAQDPFGTRLYFYQQDETRVLTAKDKQTFFGFKLTADVLASMEDGKLPQSVVDHLKGFGLSRRVSKKFVKAWLKKFDKNNGD